MSTSVGTHLQPNGCSSSIASAKKSSCGLEGGVSAQAGEVIPLALEFDGRGDVRGNTFTQVMRTDKVAMYARNGGKGYEVFRVYTEKARTIFGKQYSAKEVYPSSNDFGNKSAYCFWGPGSKERALAKYRELNR